MPVFYPQGNPFRAFPGPTNQLFLNFITFLTKGPILDPNVSFDRARNKLKLCIKGNYIEITPEADFKIQIS